VALSAEVERPELDANHSPSFKVRVKKKWSCISTPHVYLNGVYSDNFSFFYHGTIFFFAVVTVKCH
jgi:hypothetical protein